ncbi:MAG TPA: aminotransferase class I/II-fold pyridoxal phosphate-dependent enzyme [Bacteroidota bacterium]|nr:aminotransferase class I/II-fold pyridoxal phosphate-dependent enzyme [Bacteroidota bacterium]
MITLNDLNPHLLHAQYAVRGPIVQRAQELEAQGKKIIYCNIGNPQALKQRPLSFLRQALSLLENPGLLEEPGIRDRYPEDIVARVREILRKHPHGTGAYTQSPGIPFIRQAVADFIARRDGVPADKEHVILTDGASKGVQAVLLALLKNPNDGVMIPLPQYPLYSASLELYGGRQVGYFLDEENRWQLNEQILTASYTKAVAGGTHPVALVVINPGNPTGAVLSRDNVDMIIRFARAHSLSLIADEVYQENVYERNAKFHSFTRAMWEMGVRDVSLFTMHSVSKGFLGECGHRGGYLEMRNIPDDVLAQFIKLQSISLCANVSGQFATYFMVAPPQPGDASYETYVRERDAILGGLKRKAEILGNGVNTIRGMSVDVPQGAMYAFVRFTLPPEKGVDTAAMTPEAREQYEARRDSAYCLALLEETGICVVPGSGFGQKAGTFHFRTTFLPPQDEIESLVQRLKSFHEKYVHALEEA